MESSQKEVIVFGRVQRIKKMPRMQIVIILNCLVRCIWPMTAAMAGMFLSLLTFASYENATLLSSIVALFVLPSVLSFILIEKMYKSVWLKNLSFFVPFFFVLAWLIYVYFQAIRTAHEIGSDDGSKAMSIIFSITYGIGISLAFVFLHLKWPTFR